MHDQASMEVSSLLVDPHGLAGQDVVAMGHGVVARYWNAVSQLREVTVEP